MTIPGLGRLLSEHVFLLNIAGYVIPIPKDIMYPSEATVGNIKKWGCQMLVNSTGSDFGWDVLAWHRYLTGSKIFSPLFPEENNTTAYMLKIKGYDVKRNIREKMTDWETILTGWGFSAKVNTIIRAVDEKARESVGYLIKAINNTEESDGYLLYTGKKMSVAAFAVIALGKLKAAEAASEIDRWKKNVKDERNLIITNTALVDIGAVSLYELKDALWDSYDRKKFYLTVCLNAEDGEYKTHLMNICDDPGEDERIRSLALRFLFRRHCLYESDCDDRYFFEISKRAFWKDTDGKKEFVRQCSLINNELSEEYLHHIINDKDETEEIRDFAAAACEELARRPD